MSCNYADGLSPYDNKGILGVAEKFDSSDEVRRKCIILAQLIKKAKHVVVHTGAGISTSAGIPDFRQVYFAILQWNPDTRFYELLKNGIYTHLFMVHQDTFVDPTDNELHTQKVENIWMLANIFNIFRGPKGVWTLEEKGLKPTTDISFNDAKPTKTHMAIKRMADNNIINYVVSQNIDGLHLKSGLKRSQLAELHGNMFTEQCNVCNRQFVRKSPAPTVGRKFLGQQCYGARCSGRPCRGKLQDTILDWEHSLPDDDLNMSEMHSSIADLSICLGTTLQIIPSGNLPLDTIKYGGKLVICNLQPTKHDNKADLIINTYVDDVMEQVMGMLGQDIPEYTSSLDPVCTVGEEVLHWTITKNLIKQTKTLFNNKCSGVTKLRTLVKKQRDFPSKVEEVLPSKQCKLVNNGESGIVKCVVKNNDCEYSMKNDSANVPNFTMKEGITKDELKVEPLEAFEIHDSDKLIDYKHSTVKKNNIPEMKADV